MKVQEFRTLIQAAALLNKAISGTLNDEERRSVVVITDYLNEKYSSTHSHIELINYIK